LLNGAALNAALWIAASSNPKSVVDSALEAFVVMANGFLVQSSAEL